MPAVVSTAAATVASAQVSKPVTTAAVAQVTPTVRRGLSRSSYDPDVSRARILVHGQTGVGKTIFACSVSDRWNDRTPGKLTALDDTLVLLSDDDGLAGLASLGAYVPEVIDLRWLMTPPRTGETKPYAETIITALDLALKEIQAIVAEGKIKNVIIDSVSEIDRMFVKHFEDPRFVPRDRDNNEDTFKLFRAIAGRHDWMLKSISHLGVRVISVCHSKVLFEGVAAKDKEDRAMLAAKGTPGANAVIPALTGQSIEVYQRNVSLLAVITATREARTKNFTRKLYPFGDEMHRGKCRWEKYLDYEEEADMQVILKKVRDGMLKDGGSAVVSG